MNSRKIINMHFCRAVGTLALLYVVPVFFMFFQRLHEKYQGKSSLKEEELVVNS